MKIVTAPNAAQNRAPAFVPPLSAPASAYFPTRSCSSCHPHRLAWPPATAICKPPHNPSQRLRRCSSRHPSCIEPWRDSALRLCETISPPPPDPLPRLRYWCSEDRVPPRTLRRLLLP